MKETKIIVEVWSDVICPFSYIAKRNFEAALKEFPFSNEVKMIHRSFMLDNETPSDPNTVIGIHEYLQQKNGIPHHLAVKMLQGLEQGALRAGLTFNANKMIVANTFNAHRVIQFAKTKELESLAEELFLKAYFTDGKNLNSRETIIELCKEIGLTTNDINEALTNDFYSDKVNDDLCLADLNGISGVPVFIFNDELKVVGAQSTAVFLETLQKSRINLKVQRL